MYWSKVKCDAAYDAALALCKGSYQENFLRGLENLSGSTLRGKARSYGGRYKRSREALLARLSQAGIPWSEELGRHGARILVIGD